MSIPASYHSLQPHKALLNGLVLTGGNSTRMGQDKSLLTYHTKPQRVHLFDLLRRHCDAVYTSCRKEQQVPPHLNPIVDTFGIRGPLNGILSAFTFNPQAAWLIVAVDMPFIDDAALQRLISSREPTKLATCYRNVHTQAPEPLLTLWEPHAFVHLQRFVEAHKASPREFLMCHPVCMIDPPNEKLLTNINYPSQV